MTVWIVKEYEYRSGKIVSETTFNKEEDAILFYQNRKIWGRYAGLGGQWTHYWGFPVKKDERVKA